MVLQRIGGLGWVLPKIAQPRVWRQQESRDREWVRRLKEGIGSE
jgi:hypothetical protein